MPRQYIDQDWDRDAVFGCRNLVSPEFAARQLNVTTHALQKAAGRARGALPMLIFGGCRQLMPKYCHAYIDMGPSRGPDLPHAWQGHSAPELLGEARQRHVAPNKLDGLDHAAS
jgi:hypothetical protein